jgi:hypothetical protein
MAAKKKVAKQPSDSDTDSCDEPKTPEEFREAAWKIRSQLSAKIPILRTDAFALDGYYPSPDTGEDSRDQGDRFTPDRYGELHLESRKPVPVLTADDPDTKAKWGRDTVDWASNLGKELTDASILVQYRNHDWVLRFVMVTTQAAGYLLEATEMLLLEATDGIAAKTPPASPTPLEVELSMAGYTCVMGARNQIGAAEQALQNLRQKVSYKETLALGITFGVSVGLYSFFNPTWGLAKFPLSTPFWEVIFWSLFGAMAASYLRINDDTTNDVFDSRHPFQYVYRIVTAPFVAIVIIYLWCVVGISLSSSSAASALTLSTGTLTNLATLIVLSFLLGFFSKEALDILKHAWYGIAQQTESSDKGASS